MTFSVNMLLFIAGVGILQSFFLACLIYFHPKSDRSVNQFLALYIFWLCVPMFTPLVQHFYSWQHLILMEPFLLLAGPFLYFYVRSFKETVRPEEAWLHFVIFVVYVIVDYALYNYWSDEYPRNRIVPVEVLHDPWSVVRVSIRMTQMLAYTLMARHALTSYQRSINHLFSNTSKIDLGWIRWLINGFLVLILILGSLYVVILQNPDNFKLIILLNTAIVTPYLYVVTFKGVTQPTLWQLERATTKQVIQESLHQAEQQGHHTVAVPRNDKNSLSSVKQDEIISGVITAMEERRIFLQSDLTLQDIADHLNMPAYQVSQAINEGLKKTFYDLVNGYRVEEAKRLLLNNQTRNNKVLAVAFDAGFNSKTTFNTVFKKYTGVTPTEFKEQQAKALTEA